MDQPRRIELSRASAVLARYKIGAVGNTIHIRGKSHRAVQPQGGEHFDGNGGWVAFPGESELPQAIATAVAGLQEMIDLVMELEDPPTHTPPGTRGGR